MMVQTIYVMFSVQVLKKDQGIQSMHGKCCILKIAKLQKTSHHVGLSNPNPPNHQIAKSQKGCSIMMGWEYPRDTE